MKPLAPYLRDDDLERFVQQPIGRLPAFQLVEGEISAAAAHCGAPHSRRALAARRADPPLHASRGGCAPRRRDQSSQALLRAGRQLGAGRRTRASGGHSCRPRLGRRSPPLRPQGCLADAKDDPAAAAALFTSRRAAEARALVRISRGFDGRGALGTARFVLPLLLDSRLNQARQCILRCCRHLHSPEALRRGCCLKSSRLQSYGDCRRAAVSASCCVALLSAKCRLHRFRMNATASLASSSASGGSGWRSSASLWRSSACVGWLASSWCALRHLLCED